MGPKRGSILDRLKLSKNPAHSINFWPGLWGAIFDLFSGGFSLCFRHFGMQKTRPIDPNQGGPQSDPKNRHHRGANRSKKGPLLGCPDLEKNPTLSINFWTNLWDAFFDPLLDQFPICLRHFGVQKTRPVDLDQGGAKIGPQNWHHRGANGSKRGSNFGSSRSAKKSYTFHQFLDRSLGCHF